MPDSGQSPNAPQMQPLKHAPDLKQADRFLQLLDPTGVFTFQTFDDSKARKSRDLIRVLHGRFADHAVELGALNKCGAGIYVMVNEGDGVVHPGEATCRTTRSVIRVRASLVDLDNAPVDLEPVLAAPVTPDIIVETSPTKYQVYWFNEGCALERFEATQRALIAQYNGDKTVHDLPRVMRVPGFWHQKREPFQVRIAYLNGVACG